MPLDLDELDAAIRANPSTLDPPCIAVEALPQLLRIARAAQYALAHGGDYAEAHEPHWRTVVRVALEDHDA